VAVALALTLPPAAPSADLDAPPGAAAKKKSKKKSKKKCRKGYVLKKVLVKGKGKSKKKRTKRKCRRRASKPVPGPAAPAIPGTLEGILTWRGGRWWEGTPNRCLLYEFTLGSLGERQGTRYSYPGPFLSNTCSTTEDIYNRRSGFTWALQGTLLLIRYPPTTIFGDPTYEAFNFSSYNQAADSLPWTRGLFGESGAWAGCRAASYPPPLRSSAC
jgi:hypothetical protein